ncbi:hypothetical protein GCM10012275_60680 [Longimycelium tulufanense]|uniref:Uncharacterized protein n=1 Tax=Longimycelium tulufanense TaxID=907463 RepID=A0A8J3FYG7_9PSEU|nr:hypothetical protein [Longimycelium tulufanense]GGM81950.1 hypothetical protein GCM10012275_60680 [Longimycelium tulufanense]
MTEPSGDAERRVAETLYAALSVAMSVALQAQRLREIRAREALRRSEAEQRHAARQLAAERELAATLWRRAGDLDWVARNPQQVAEAWASARVWSSVDRRAAEALRWFEEELRRRGVNPHVVAYTQQTEDYAALAMLLRHAVEPQVDAERAARTAAQQAATEPRVLTDRQWQQWAAELHRQANVRMPREGKASAVEMVTAGRPGAERYAVIGYHPEIGRWGMQFFRHQEAQAFFAETANSSAEELRIWTVLTGPAAAEREQAAAQRAQQQAREQTPQQEPQQQPRMTPEERDVVRQEAAATVLRSAWAAHPDMAEAVIACEAFGAFAWNLEKVAEQGYDPHELLSRIPLQGERGTLPIVEADRPAAFATSLVKNRVEHLPEPHHAGEAPRLEDYARRVAQQAAATQQAAPGEPVTPPAPQSAPAPEPGPADPDLESLFAHEPADDEQAPPPPEEAVASQAAPAPAAEARLPQSARGPASSASAAGKPATPDYRCGAYEKGAAPAQLAGQGFPVSIHDALQLAQQQKKQQQAKAAPAARRAARRGRGEERQR